MESRADTTKGRFIEISHAFKIRSPSEQQAVNNLRAYNKYNPQVVIEDLIAMVDNLFGNVEILTAQFKALNDEMEKDDERHSEQ